MNYIELLTEGLGFIKAWDDAGQRDWAVWYQSANAQYDYNLDYDGDEIRVFIYNIVDGQTDILNCVFSFYLPIAHKEIT
jgi:hypothetical protein